MARQANEILQNLIGQFIVQLAQVQSALEATQEALAERDKQIAEWHIAAQPDQPSEPVSPSV